jgi:hypothetical protein
MNDKDIDGFKVFFMELNGQQDDRQYQRPIMNSQMEERKPMQMMTTTAHANAQIAWKAEIQKN